MTNLIAFVGDRGAGKDTACDALSLYGFKKVAFADPLRDVAQRVFGLTMEEMLDPALKEKPLERYPYMSPRQILMRLGTECFRDNFPGVWIQAWRRTTLSLHRVVVSDCRFADEAEAIKSLGGILVRVRRPGYQTQDAHRSEQEWLEFEFDDEIVNDCHCSTQWRVKVCDWYAKLRAPDLRLTF